MANWWRSYIARRSRAMGLDPRAVLAVAAQEGLGGGVGDQGSSYGPFQLHRGGALPSGRGQQWAESPAGIDYALSRIASVARGQHGQQAISSIVSRFERPADPRSEIQGAISAYGRTGVGPDTGPGSFRSPSSPGPAAAPDLRGLRANVLQSLIAASQSNAGAQTDYSRVFSSLSALRQARDRPASVVASPPTVGLSGIQAGGSPKGGPSLSFLTPLAKRFGLNITSTTSGRHVSGSYHYQKRAEDYGGSPQRMAALARYAAQHPGQFTEMFYTGPGNPGVFVKNGKAYPLAQLNAYDASNHRDHVHLAR